MIISAKDPSIHKPRFCEGSIMRHVIVMAGIGTIGLMAVFLVDFLNLFYISRLGDTRYTAAIGFANVINFLQVAICIGMSIGITVVTARLIGAKKHDLAGQIINSFLLLMTVIMIVIGIAIMVFRYPILSLLGAQDLVLEQAGQFIAITSPFLCFIGLGMALSGLLRAVGDAKGSMYITIAGALVTAVLDPLFILYFGWGLEGAAVSTVFSRAAVAVFGFYSLRKYQLIHKPVWKKIFSDSYPVFVIAFPAILTNLATPAGNTFVIKTMASFGSDAIAGQTAIDRIVPVAFAFVFALTGSVGPIISQNFGAGFRDRMCETLMVSLKLVCLCVLCAWILFFVGEEWIVKMFALKAAGIELMRLFCHWVILSNLFLGMLFVSNTAFNNLGYPLLSTLFNWGRATLGTIPFVWFGATYGPKGILVGQAIGVMPFGFFAVLCAFYVLRNIKINMVSYQ